MNLKDVDPNNFAQVEQYVDTVVNSVWETAQLKTHGSCSTCYEIINLFRDHIISMISPNYFNKIGE